MTDPLVEAFDRRKETLLTTWAFTEGRVDIVKADNPTYVQINRAKLLRARLAQTENPVARQKIIHKALMGA